MIAPRRPIVHGAARGCMRLRLIIADLAEMHASVFCIAG
jgi:hypothetical protein